MSEREQLARAIARLAKSPLRFVREVIGAEPEAWQADALETIATNPKLAVRSGHGVGKTTFEAWLILWAGCCLEDCKIGVTAPAAPQIDANLFPDLRKWRKRMAEHSAMGAWFAEAIGIKSDAVDFGNGNICVARTARPDQPEALQGLHAKNILFLIDEASGVSEAVFEASAGALSTPGARIVMCGNPTRASGYFWSAFTQSRAFWKTMKVSCEDVSPERVDRGFIEEARTKYGLDSNFYRVRVLGEFPTSEDDVVIPLHLCEAAVSRKVDQTGPRIVWGLDVARFGSDRTALAKRWGNTLTEPVKSWRGKSTMEVCGLVMAEYLASEHKPDIIAVDVIGIGAGVVDRLAEQNLPVVGVNVAESPSVADRYMRQRDELWFEGRAWLEQRNTKLPPDDALIAEMTSVKYKVTSTGKLQVESKDEMKKRGMDSPDLADAFLLTFTQADLAPRQMTYIPPA